MKTCFSYNKSEGKGAMERKNPLTTSGVYTIEYIGGYVQPSFWAL
jgi:hypothetical protein